MVIFHSYVTVYQRVWMCLLMGNVRDITMTVVGGTQNEMFRMGCQGGC